MKIDFAQMGAEALKNENSPVVEEKKVKREKKEPVKKEENKQVEEKKPVEEKKVEERREENQTAERFVPIIDLSDPRIVIVTRKRRSKNGEKAPAQTSSTFAALPEEIEILDELCQKYRMSRSELIRTWIINSR